MSRVVRINHHGEVWPAFGAASVHRPQGVIELHRWPTARVYLNTTGLTVAALTTLEQEIDTLPRGIHLNIAGTDRTPKDIIVSSSEQALSHILEFADKATSARFQGRLVARDVLEQIPAQSFLTEVWRNAHGTLELDHIRGELARHFPTYLTAYLDDGAMRFGEFSSGWKIYKSRNWLRHCVGKRVEEQPDTAYGHYIASNYRELWDISEPVATEALMHVKDPTGDGHKRLHYTRLALPVTNAGRRQLLIASYTHSSAPV